MTRQRASASRYFARRPAWTYRAAGAALSDEEMLARPIDSFDIDSLETMEFIMGVEDRFDIVLNEEAVNRCSNIAELVELVSAARRV